MATSAQYAATSRTAVALISTANTNRNGSGTIVTVFSAGASGSRVDDVTIQSTGTVTAGAVRLYLYNGTTHFMIREVLVTATTPSTTVQAWNSSFTNLGLILQNGWSLTASTNNAESFNVAVTRAGDF
jgi:hypothetical protein